MAKIIKIKNTGVVNGTWVGTVIAPSVYYTLDIAEFVDFADSSKVFTDIGSGLLVVNDGVDDLGILDGWDWLAGNKLTISQTSEVGAKKLWVHSSSKPEFEGQRFFSQWVGYGDNLTNNEIGGGQQCVVQTAIGSPSSTIDIDFDNMMCEVYLHEGYALWTNASYGDSFSAFIMSKPNVLQTAANLDLEMGTENRIVAAAGGAGTGTHGWSANPILVPCFHPSNDGFWDYDEVNGLVAAPAQDGAYNIYDIEIKVQAFIHKVPLLGSSTMLNRFVSSDVSKMPVNYFIRIEANNNSNTVWELAVMITTYREKTINSIHDGI